MQTAMMPIKTLPKYENMQPMGGSGGHGEKVLSPEKSQNIGFLSKTGPNQLKNHKATKPAFNVGSSGAF